MSSLLNSNSEMGIPPSRLIRYIDIRLLAIAFSRPTFPAGDYAVEIAVATQNLIRDDGVR
jgi:hypothetical protein